MDAAPTERKRPRGGYLTRGGDSPQVLAFCRRGPVPASMTRSASPSWNGGPAATFHATDLNSPASARWFSRPAAFAPATSGRPDTRTSWKLSINPAQNSAPTRGEALLNSVRSSPDNPITAGRWTPARHQWQPRPNSPAPSMNSETPADTHRRNRAWQSIIFNRGGANR